MIDYYIIDKADKSGLAYPCNHKWVFGSRVFSFEEYNHKTNIGNSCALGLACKIAINLILRNYASNCKPCHIYISCISPPTDEYLNEFKILTHLVKLQIGKITFHVTANLKTVMNIPKEFEINYIGDRNENNN